MMCVVFNNNHQISICIKLYMFKFKRPTWDFPNGGPPHYQNPISSEYERPPPYYYPGPSGPPG